MTDWIVAWRKDKREDQAYKIQINKNNVTHIKVYNDKVEIYMTNNSFLLLYFQDWEVSF